MTKPSEGKEFKNIKGGKDLPTELLYNCKETYEANARKNCDFYNI